MSKAELPRSGREGEEENEVLFAYQNAK